MVLKLRIFTYFRSSFFLHLVFSGIEAAAIIVVFKHFVRILLKGGFNFLYERFRLRVGAQNRTGKC